MAQELFSVHRNRLAVRLSVLRLTVTVLMVGVALSYWFIQVVQHNKFQQLAENNHRRSVSLRAPRGILFDRDGTVLVENRYSFDISIVRELTTDLEYLINKLVAITGIQLRDVQDEIDRHSQLPEYQPIVIIRDASLSQVAAVAARRFELPGIAIEQVPTRRYRVGTSAAHLLGYVGEITADQIASLDFVGLSDDAVVGQSGLEFTYNQLLMGTDGRRQVIVNSVGRELETIETNDPINGTRLQLTLDADLQNAAEEAFAATGFSGAAIVLEPETGEVLVMTSVPTYDPNAFALGIDMRSWQALNMDDRRPLHNRGLQGRYSPGSIFKIVVATAALEEGLVTPDFKVSCPGSGVFHGQRFFCHLRGGHGELDMQGALERSCNVYFYTLGSLLEIDLIEKWAKKFGLNQVTGIDLPYEAAGLVPSREWKQEVNDEPWYPGETISVAIGQGPVNVTPLSIAVMMATVANGGIRPTPHLLKAVDSGNGWSPVKTSMVGMVELSPETIQTLHEGLWRVVNGQGTGRRARIDGFDVAGKTATSQVMSLEGRAKVEESDSEFEWRDHGWFAFFAPRNDAPELAGVVLAEHSDHGYLAAPIARHIMTTYLAKKDGRPLPEFPRPQTPVTTTNLVTEP